jgi:hypothetical protein
MSFKRYFEKWLFQGGKFKASDTGNPDSGLSRQDNDEIFPGKGYFSK